MLSDYIMIIRFNNEYLEQLYVGHKTKGKPLYSDVVITKFKKTVEILKFAEDSNDLKKFKGLYFEKFSGNLKRFYSVRIDLKYRLILSLEEDEIELHEILIIEDLTNHYD